MAEGHNGAIYIMQDRKQSGEVIEKGQGNIFPQ
jgi:hypothetical protein